MKVLVFTDPHGNVNLLKKHARDIKEKKIDLVLMTGDLTFFGSDLKELLTILNNYKAPVFIIHGNHEDEKEMQILCEPLKNITFLHKKMIKVQKWWFGAYSTSGLRDEYSDQETWVQKHAKEIKEKQPLIWLDHPPARDTLLDNLGENWHVGSISLAKFIKEFKPKYVLCGHLHETFGMEDMIEETIIINSGPTGKILELD